MTGEMCVQITCIQGGKKRIMRGRRGIYELVCTVVRLLSVWCVYNMLGVFFKSSA